jgi:hypothetical protein
LTRAAGHARRSFVSTLFRIVVSRYSCGTMPRSVYDLFFLAALILGTSLIISHSTRQLSATFDETFYLDAGLTSWRTGSNKMLMKAGTMPLPVEMETLPLYLIERYRAAQYRPESDFGEMLSFARSVNLLFWGALLVYGWRIGFLLGGVWAGRAAALLLATEPSLLAHAGLATTDLALTAGVLAATYHFLTRPSSGWKDRVVIPGAFYGMAILCKASALAFVPLIWAVLGMRELIVSGEFRPWAVAGFGTRLNHIRTTTARLRWEFAGQFFVAMIVTFAYCGSDWRTERTFVEWAHKLPSGPLRDTAIPVSENLKIFTNAGEALAQQIKHNFRGHGCYVLGQWHERAVWYYFPVCLAAKLTLPVLCLTAIGVIFLRQDYFGPAGWIVLALFLFSLNCRVQIGIRLVFPLVAFLLIASAIAWARPAAGITTYVRWLILGTAIGLQSLTALSSGPDRLSYHNPLAAGRDVLADSNVDWGQGLFELKVWHADSVRPLSLWYFGTDPRADQLGFQKIHIHMLPATITAEDLRRMFHGRDLAVSLSILHGKPNATPAGRTAIEWLNGLGSVERVGPFLIFRPE